MSTQHHYIAAFGMGWKTALTRDEAVKGLVEGFRSDFKTITAACHKEGKPGAYIWSCKVLAPIDAKYSIEWFQPVGVELADAEEHYVTYVTNKQIAYHTEGDKKS